MKINEYLKKKTNTGIVFYILDDKMAIENKRFQYWWLIVGTCLVGVFWMTFHTKTRGMFHVKFNASFISKIKPKTTNLTLPIRVHIYNKIDGYFAPNSFAGCNWQCYETSGTHNYNSSKYVLFLEPLLGDHLPKKIKDQVWIFYSHESPHYHSTQNFKLWRDLVNLTFSYRRDSDLYMGFGGFQKHTFGKSSVKETSYEKTNPKFSPPIKMSWMVSNCNTPGKRRKYVDTIAKEPNVTVDIYGKCGAQKCPRNQESGCMNTVGSKYPYYLSFENSLCVDYISEKSFKIYSNNLNTIPVVRGNNGTYKKFLPKNSYLNVNEFSSVKQLIEKQKQILYNKETFNSFFDWRTNYVSWRPDGYCRLCELLINLEITRKSHYYEDFDLWLKGNKKRPMCREPKDV